MARPRKNLGQNSGNDLPPFNPTTDNQPSQQTTQTQNMKTKLIVSGIFLVIALVLTLTAVKIVTIQGNQLGVKETWGNGVEANILQPKTYFLFPGWSQTVIKYDASSQVFVMNDKAMHEEKSAAGREKDAYLVQSQEGQDMKISLNLRWRLDPAKLVSIHKTVRNSTEEKIIRPVVMRVVKDEATKMKAIDAYSGEGLVRLQSNIQAALTGAGEGAELHERGIIVENFVIEHIELDPKYIEEIKGKQIASQRSLRAVEEQKAAEAEALVAKSKAQADLNKAVVEAQRDKEVVVLKAQAAQEQQVLAAKGQQQQLTIEAEGAKAKLIAEAEGKKQAMIATAEGTLAMGKAEANARELMLKAYDVKGADAWVRVEVAKSVAAAFQNIKGYLPSDMKVNLLTDNFGKSVDALTGNPIVTPTPAPSK
jgi:regulator of protease activity HflC (stomatin/prohibitin superfamily)